MQKVASVKGPRKTERKGQKTKLRTVNGKKKKQNKTGSPNFGLCACPELKFCSLLYLILGKSLLLVKKAFLAKLRLIQRHGS